MQLAEQGKGLSGDLEYSGENSAVQLQLQKIAGSPTNFTLGFMQSLTPHISLGGGIHYCSSSFKERFCYNCGGSFFSSISAHIFRA